jgi:hypothetical protein
MQRPNKLFVSATSRRDGEQSSYLVVSDGATLTYWRSWTNSFVQTTAPAVLAGIARQLPDDAIGTFADGAWEEQSIAEWDLLTNDRTPSITKGLGAGGGLTATGPEKHGGALVHVVRVTTAPAGLPFTFEQRYYLDAESYLLRGLATSGRGKHPETGRDFTVDMQAQYELISTRPTFSDADFRFVAPRGARPDKGARRVSAVQARVGRMCGAVLGYPAIRGDEWESSKPSGSSERIAGPWIRPIGGTSRPRRGCTAMPTTAAGGRSRSSRSSGGPT